jgi:hypothetical protein
MEFLLFRPATIRNYLEAADDTIEDIIERAPYHPDVEHLKSKGKHFRPQTQFHRSKKLNTPKMSKSPL